MQWWIARHGDSILGFVLIMATQYWLRGKSQPTRYRFAGALGVFALVCWGSLYLMGNS